MILTVGEREIYEYLMENANLPGYDAKLFAREYYRKGLTKEQALEEYRKENENV